MNLREKPFIQLCIGPILLCLAWYASPLFAFAGFVPLLFIDRYYSIHKSNFSNIRLFGWVYLYFLLWNVGTTWWIYNSTWLGAALAFICNSLLMTITFMLFRFSKNVLVDKLDGYNFRWMIGYAGLPFFWIAFEFIHHQWEITWPWLSLGNCFAFMPKVVQWYEYTGILGGSAWILTVNLMIYRVLNVAVIVNRKWVLPMILIFLPMLFSVILYSSVQEKGSEIEVVVVQPNIDPYEEKFKGSSKFIPYEDQLNRLLELSKSKVSHNTSYLLWPETSIPANFDEDLINDQPIVLKIRKFLSDYPNLTLIAGIDSYKIYLKQFDASPTARYNESIGYYDYFNAALQLNDHDKARIYHKSKLVPGVEILPYATYLKFIENFTIDMGGITGSLGTQKQRTVFYNEENQGIAPIICYESIFGDFVSEYVRNGAQLLGIITNDGWWGDTPGYTQHFAYARLRAIETRRSIARAANTGISGFINQKGDVLLKTEYWKPDAARMLLHLNQEKTFYTLYGDYLGTLAVWWSVIVLLITWFISNLRKKYVRRLFNLQDPIYEPKLHS
jgi:apolipoprotein N-acyltransferase